MGENRLHLSLVKLNLIFFLNLMFLAKVIELNRLTVKIETEECLTSNSEECFENIINPNWYHIFNCQVSNFVFRYYYIFGI